jgi:hypothetical protein
MRYLMPFGAHRGRALDEIESGYLAWLAGRIEPGSLRRHLVAELAKRGVPVQVTPPPPEPTCGQCGGVEMTYRWQEDSLGRRHIRRTCARCNRWCGFANTEYFADRANAAEGETTP